MFTAGNILHNSSSMWECMDNHIAFIPRRSIYEIIAIFLEMNSRGPVLS